MMHRKVGRKMFIRQHDNNYLHSTTNSQETKQTKQSCYSESRRNDNYVTLDNNYNRCIIKQCGTTPVVAHNVIVPNA